MCNGITKLKEVLVIVLFEQSKYSSHSAASLAKSGAQREHRDWLDSSRPSEGNRPPIALDHLNTGRIIEFAGLFVISMSWSAISSWQNSPRKQSDSAVASLVDFTKVRDSQ